MKKLQEESQEHQQIGSINVARLHDEHLSKATHAPEDCTDNRTRKKRNGFEVCHMHSHMYQSHQFLKFHKKKTATTSKIIQSRVERTLVNETTFSIKPHRLFKLNDTNATAATMTKTEPTTITMATATATENHRSENSKTDREIRLVVMGNWLNHWLKHTKHTRCPSFRATK